MRIAILDNDLRFSDQLYQKISMGFAKRDWALNCHIFSHPQDLLNSNLGTLHAVFLDIDMPEMNGLEVASQIRQHYPDLILVFITAFLQFAPSGYKVSAFRYILKENYIEELDSCLDAIQDKRSWLTQKTFRLKFPYETFYTLRVLPIVVFYYTQQKLLPLY